MASAERWPILVVEDDEEIVRPIELLLREEGYPVVIAANGKAALDRGTLLSSASFFWIGRCR